jgi:formamidopyrimidine-DNA glycosylase
MPELPDLEVFAINLQKNLKGKTLEDIKIKKTKNTNASSGQFKKELVGQRLNKVFREGKELRFLFQNKNILGVHLMLRGKLVWLNDKNKSKYSIVELMFSNGFSIAITDPQYKARVTLNPKESDAPDALSKQVNLNFWKEQLQSKATIKNLLLDQHTIRGIGNAYADEILWSAGISPFSISNKIPAQKIKALANAVRKVLLGAEQKIKMSDPDIIGGEIRGFLLIHNSKKKKSPKGAPIKIKSAGGRKTYYTDEQVTYQ